MKSKCKTLIENYLPKASYSFQHTLSNGKRVDAIIHLPGEQDDVAIDSKFPMESWRHLTDAENTTDEIQAAKQFSRDVTIHIKDVAEKYLIPGETHDVAMLFLPSEAIYAELHSNFPKIIDKSFELKVMIVSPTTFHGNITYDTRSDERCCNAGTSSYHSERSDFVKQRH